MNILFIKIKKLIKNSLFLNRHAIKILLFMCILIFSGCSAHWCMKPTKDTIGYNQETQLYITAGLGGDNASGYVNEGKLWIREPSLGCHFTSGHTSTEFSFEGGRYYVTVIGGNQTGSVNIEGEATGGDRSIERGWGWPFDYIRDLLFGSGRFYHEWKKIAITIVPFFIYPSNATLYEGESKQFIIIDQYNNQISWNRINWKVTGDIGTINNGLDNNGLFNAVLAGNGNIVATIDYSIIIQASVTVNWKDTNNDNYADYSGTYLGEENMGSGQYVNLDNLIKGYEISGTDPNMTLDIYFYENESRSSFDENYIYPGTNDQTIYCTLIANGYSSYLNGFTLSLKNEDGTPSNWATFYDGSTNMDIGGGVGGAGFSVMSVQQQSNSLQQIYNFIVKLKKNIGFQDNAVSVVLDANSKDYDKKARSKVWIHGNKDFQNKIDNLISKANEYRNNTTGYWARYSEDGQYLDCGKKLSYTGASSFYWGYTNYDSGVAYSYGGKDSNDLFNEKMQRANSRGINQWADYKSKNTFRVGLFEEEYTIWLNKATPPNEPPVIDDKSPWCFAGVDCSGFVQNCLVSAGFSYIPKLIYNKHYTSDGTQEYVTVSRASDKEKDIDSDSLCKTDSTKYFCKEEIANRDEYINNNRFPLIGKTVEKGDIVGFQYSNSGNPKNGPFKHVGIVYETDQTVQGTKIIHAWGNRWMGPNKNKPDFPKEFWGKVTVTPIDKVVGNRTPQYWVIRRLRK